MALDFNLALNLAAFKVFGFYSNFPAGIGLAFR